MNAHSSFLLAGMLLALCVLIEPVCGQFIYVNSGSHVTITGYNGSGGNVTIPETIAGLPVTGIANNAFYDNDTLVQVTIPYTVTSIGSDAFYACNNLNVLVLPNGLSTIGDRAFFVCDHLINVVIPSSVVSVGSLAFAACDSLISIDVSPLNTLYSSVEGVLFNKDYSTIIQFPGGKSGSYVLPIGVGRIGPSAFAYCKSLTGVIVPAGVFSIGVGAFRNCFALSGVELPTSVTGIGDNAFYGCDGLKTFTIPFGVLTIGVNAFFDCDGLSNITIPSSVVSIGNDAFRYCAKLVEVSFLGDAPAMGSSVFSNASTGFAIRYLAYSEGFLPLAWQGYPSSQITVPSLNPIELRAPKFRVMENHVEFTILASVFGRRYKIQKSDAMREDDWFDFGTTQYVGNGTDLLISIPNQPAGTKSFYRLILDGPMINVGEMIPIPAGEFEMGDVLGDSSGNIELPVHSVSLNSFYLARYELTKGYWDKIATWASANGYDITASSTAGKAADNPAYRINWYECLKWCNARSEKEGLTPCYTISETIYRTGQSDIVECNFGANGYRLPTEAEWEKAARGGVAGQRFPWGNVISHYYANYFANGNDYGYDVSPYTVNTHHPAYNRGIRTSPVGVFSPNGFGLHDMAGNVFEWCWDWYDSNYYSSSPVENPRGPSSGTNRIFRGGSVGYTAPFSRVSFRTGITPYCDGCYGLIGFRPARSLVP